MSSEPDTESTPPTPDDAFAVLGNETRMEIIQTLGESDEPLSFSELRDSVGVSDSGQFNYHLDKLVGHFVGDTDDGYELRRAGERIIEAIVSGAVTESPTIKPTEIEWPCSQCGAPLELSYQQEWVGLSCTECPGLYGGELVEDESAPEKQLKHGYHGGLDLPPAAVQGQDAVDVLQTAFKWDFLETLASSSGICPRCSAPVEQTLDVCENHDAGDGPCETCGTRNKVTYETTCPNCPFRIIGSLPAGLQANTDVLDFQTDHGYNPMYPTEDQFEIGTDIWDEEVTSIDPVEVELSFVLDGDFLTLKVNEELNVIDATRTPETSTE